MICSFLRGLSVRDVEAALEECLGEQVIGRSTVARVCKDIAARSRLVRARPLRPRSRVLYLDAIYLKLRADDEPAEGVLVAWGSRWRAGKCCSACSSEAARVMRPGLISAATSRPAGCVPGVDRRRRSPRDLEGYPRAVGPRRPAALHGPRLQEHHLKLPERLHREVKARYWQILDDADRRGSEDRAARARRRLPGRVPVGDEDDRRAR